MGIQQLKPPKQQQKSQSKLNMSEWVRLDITSFTKTTNREKILKILKGAKVECCEITDPYMNTDRNKNCISIVISELISKLRLQTTQGHGLLKRTMQPSQQEDRSSKQLPMKQIDQNIQLSLLEDSARSKIPAILFTFNHVNCTFWTNQNAKSKFRK